MITPHAKGVSAKYEVLMKKRVITGAVYVIILLALLVMKWLVPYGYGAAGFDLLFCAVSIIGSIELLNAYKEVSFPQRAVTIAFCAAVVPMYALCAFTMGGASNWIAVACLAIIYVIALACINIFHYGQSTLRGTMLCLTVMLYCGILCTVLSAVNHLTENSLAAILLIFISVMLTDCFALFFGMLFKRWLPYKLAPKISPQKTIIGGFGGLIGGMVGAIAAYYVDFGLGKVTGGAFAYDGNIPGVVLFLIIGLITSVVAQMGDLFESAIKRECGVKDMGNLLPGHGGVLDRFDSMLFSGVIVLFSFFIISI